MKHRLKGLLALVLSLVMVLSMVTVSTASQSSGSGSAPTEYHVSVGGTKVTSANAANVLAGDAANDGKVSYDAANNTLTLNGVTISDTYYGSAITAEGDLTINLIGDNTVTHNDSGGIAAIHVAGDLTIKEGRDDGSLTASDTGTNFDGILASGKVTIESGKVTANGGNSGIYANSVTITGGTVTAGSATDGDSGDVSYNSFFGIKADSSISITGGTVTATGFDAIAINEHTTTTGTISISGATTTVTANGGNSGIYANGSVTISGGDVTATATENDSCGIYAEGSVTISSGKVTAKATENDSCGIYGGNTIAISGANTKVDVGCETGLQADIVNIAGGSTVSINAENANDKNAIDSRELNMSGDYQWSTDGINFNNSTTLALSKDAAKGTADLYIKPITYTVTYANGGGVGTDPTQTSTAAGGTFTLAQNPYTKSGYTFAGWNDGANTYAAGATYTMPDNDVIITAQWTENSTGGPGTPQPPAYYPIYIPTVEDEPEVTAPKTFDGGIASAVVVTILSATGGAWLAKKKD